MKKVLSLILVLCLVLPVVVACSSGTTATPAATGTPSIEATPTPWAFDGANYKGEVHVGVLCSLTGPVPLEGELERNGSMLAAELWNAKGGINGYKIVLNIEDDANENTATLAAATKLASDENVKIIVGPIRSAGCKAIADTIGAAKVPMLAGGTSPSLVGLANGYMFRMRTSDTDMGTAAARYIAEVLKATKVGILYNNDDYGNGARGVIVDYLEKNTDVEVAVQEGHNTGDKDMTAGLLAVKEAGCDAMVVWTHSPEGAVIVRQYKELGLDSTVKLLGGPIWGMGGFHELVDDSLIDGQKGVMEFAVSNDAEVSKQFVADYNAKFGTDPLSHAANWYDALNIAFRALELCGEDFARESVKANLPKVDFEGVAGHLYLGTNGFDFIHRALIGEIDASNNVKTIVNVEYIDSK